jgi:hypothetical protein
MRLTLFSLGGYMPTKPVTRGTFVRTIFASLGAAVSGGLASLSLFGSRKAGRAVAVVREPRTVARRDV